MRRLAALVVVFVAAAVPAVAKEGAPPPPASGRIVDFQILPPEGTFTAGSAITFTNEGGRPHTVTDRGGLFDTGAILPGAQGTVKLDVPGTYEIFCQINPSKMNATVVVTPGDAAPTEVRVQAFDEARSGETKRFDPAQLEVAEGTRLILANVGGLRHSLYAEDGSFHTAIVDPGEENGRFAGHNASVVVTEPGTHVFFCEIHPTVMRGTLVVTPAKVTAKARGAPARAERPPPRAAVSVRDFAFDKPETTVAPGGTVTWTNSGAAPHTATFDDITLDTGNIAPGKSAQLTAPGQPGTYSYRCNIHPAKMRGVLVVSPERAAAVKAVGAANTSGGDAAGTIFAWVVAVLVVGVGVLGLAMGLRRAN